MQYKSKLQLSLCVTVLLLSGCASNGLEHRPTVTGQDIANYEVDLKSCQNLAAKDKELNKSTEGGLAGAATGAIAGVLSDSSDILTSAVVGAIVGVAGGSYYSEKAQREYIIKCMQDLGYNVEAND
jgi:hypothetical protein